MARGLGLRDLAVRSGVDGSIISRLETGKQATLRRNNYAKLAEALGLTYRELQELAGEVPASPHGMQPRVTLEDHLRMEGLLSEEQIDILLRLHADFARRR